MTGVGFVFERFVPGARRHAPRIARLARVCGHVSVLALLASIMTARPAHADPVAAEPDAPGPDEIEAIRLKYLASEGCPDEADFATRIRARTTRARVAWPGEPARTFEVTVDAGPPPSGSVTVLEADRPTGTRSVHADTCADVADALALVIALSIDPHASAPVPAPAEPPPTASGHDAPTVDASTHEVASPSHPPEPRSGNALAGADLAVTYGVVPGALVVGSPYVGWRFDALGPFDPAVRIAFVRATSDVPVPSTGSAAFTWTAGRLDACPVEWASAVVRLTACARVEVGALAVAASGVPAPETRVRPWFAAGLLGRGEWTFLRPMFLDAELGVLARATDDRFFFQPDTTVYRVPVLAMSAGIGLGVHFL